MKKLFNAEMREEWHQAKVSSSFTDLPLPEGHF